MLSCWISYGIEMDIGNHNETFDNLICAGSNFTDYDSSRVH